MRRGAWAHSSPQWRISIAAATWPSSPIRHQRMQLQCEVGRVLGLTNNRKFSIEDPPHCSPANSSGRDVVCTNNSYQTSPSIACLKSGGVRAIQRASLRSSPKCDGTCRYQRVRQFSGNWASWSAILKYLSFRQFNDSYFSLVERFAVFCQCACARNWLWKQWASRDSLINKLDDDNIQFPHRSLFRRLLTKIVRLMKMNLS